MECSAYVLLSPYIKYWKSHVFKKINEGLAYIRGTLCLSLQRSSKFLNGELQSVAALDHVEFKY
jgi:hypothetical protein